MNIPVLTTTRLVLRPLELADAASIQKRFPRWEIVRFLVAEIPWPYPADGAERFVRELALPAMQAGREWHWSIRPASSSDQLIGVVSLMDKPDNNRGFWIDPDWQGQGVASEASAAATDFWFETLGRSVLRVPKAAINTPSRRISERTGMRLVGTTEGHYVSGRHLTEVWEITRDEWRARSSQPIAQSDRR
ncbi:MAG: GNAT family N-acetyltransferase [Pseudomonadota bacterium]